MLLIESQKVTGEEAEDWGTSITYGLVARYLSDLFKRKAEKNPRKRDRTKSRSLEPKCPCQAKLTTLYSLLLVTYYTTNGPDLPPSRTLAISYICLTLPIFWFCNSSLLRI